MPSAAPLTQGTVTDSVGRVTLSPGCRTAAVLRPVCRRRFPPQLLRCGAGLFIPCSSSWNCCEGAKARRSMTLSKEGLKVIVKTINNKVQTAGLYVM